MNTKNKQRARLALAELEKEMEILTKEQMNACKGGAVFFDLSGNYLGRYGFSDEIRIVSKSEYEGLFWKPVTNQDYLDNMGSGLMEASRSLKYAVVNYYARQIGLSGNLTVQVAQKNLFQGDPHAAVFLDKSGNTGAYYNETSNTLKNESSIVSTLQHENSHLTGCMQDTGECEVNTFLAQIDTPAYNNTNNNYRKQTAEYLWENFQRYYNEKSGNVTSICLNSIEDAYRYCKVEGY